MHENKHPFGNMSILIGAPTFGLGKAIPEPAQMVQVTTTVEPKERQGFYRAPLHSLAEPAPVEPTMEDNRLVREMMHYGVISCNLRTPVEEVAHRMVNYHVHAIVVTDNAGYAVGIVSQTDVVLARQGRTVDELAALTAGEVMSCLL